jgi:glycosyltransferase involved in cell wall biosynthesis
MITVLQLLHSLNVGGAEMLAARLARRLRDKFRFVFACLDELGPLGHDLQSDGFTVRLLGRKAGIDWNCPLRLAHLMRDEHVNVLHAHQYTPFFYGMAARMRGARRPILFTEHGRHQPDYPRRKRMLANRLFLSRRDRVVAVGHAVRRALIDNEGIPDRRIDVIYNGVDVAHFANLHEFRPELRQELGLSDDDFAIVQVARLDYLKDHLTAIRCMARVARENPRVRLLLAGDGPERAQLEFEVNRLNLSETVRFLGLRKDVDRLLHAADLFLLTSVSEGIPLTVIEAMAARLPVVATDVGGMSEIVLNDVTGLLAPAKDDASLADRVLQLSRTPDKRRQLGEAGFDRARKLFDEFRMCSEYSRLFRDMGVGREIHVPALTA